MADAVKEATGVDFFNVQNDEEAKHWLKRMVLKLLKI